MQLKVTRQGQSLLTATGSGACDLTNQTADCNSPPRPSWPRCSKPSPNPTSLSPPVPPKLKTHLTRQQNTQTLNGTFALGGFAAKFGTNELRDLGLTADFGLELASPLLQIRKLDGQLTAASKPAATFSGHRHLRHRHQRQCQPPGRSASDPGAVGPAPAATEPERLLRHRRTQEPPHPEAKCPVRHRQPRPGGFHRPVRQQCLSQFLRHRQPRRGPDAAAGPNQQAGGQARRRRQTRRRIRGHGRLQPGQPVRPVQRQARRLQPDWPPPIPRTVAGR